MASNGTVTLESAGWGGGRLLPGSGSDKVLYTVADHLGSVRVVKDGMGNIRQRFDYYPYGTVSYVWTSSSTTDSSEKRYRFGGKEIAGSSLTDLVGYGAAPGAPYLDFGARLYSPHTATWLSPDPLMEKYYSISPFTYCAGNPINLVDPSGNWIIISNGVLEAEKNDNAWTLASFLNTSPEIATRLLSEQNYTTNGKGVLNLKVGDQFFYDVYTSGNAQQPSLGVLGNSIRSHLSSDFSKELFNNYWQGNGDYDLSGREFAGILMYLKQTGSLLNKGIVSLVGESGRLYLGSKATASFYESDNYSLALGTATVYLNSREQIVGFYDAYDFNPLPKGSRSIKNEIKTRLVNIVSPRNAKEFKIRYGYKAN